MRRNFSKETCRNSLSARGGSRRRAHASELQEYHWRWKVWADGRRPRCHNFTFAGLRSRATFQRDSRRRTFVCFDTVVLGVKNRDELMQALGAEAAAPLEADRITAIDTLGLSSP